MANLAPCSTENFTPWPTTNLAPCLTDGSRDLSWPIGATSSFSFIVCCQLLWPATKRGFLRCDGTVLLFVCLSVACNTILLAALSVHSAAGPTGPSMSQMFPSSRILTLSHEVYASGRSLVEAAINMPQLLNFNSRDVILFYDMTVCVVSYFVCFSVPFFTLFSLSAMNIVLCADELHSLTLTFDLLTLRWLCE